MITGEKLRIYEKFGGDSDGFARSATLSERLAITDAEWHLIEEIRQSLFIVQSGLASREFEASVRARLHAVVEDEKVNERLCQLAKPRS